MPVLRAGGDLLIRERTFTVDPVSGRQLVKKASSVSSARQNSEAAVTMVTDFSTRQVCILAALACLIMVVQGLPQRSKVSDEALETALNDKRYLQRQMKCVLGEANCDPVGRRLKSLAPLVLRGSCPQCSPDETRQIQRTLSHIQRNYPKEWAKILKQYAGA